MTVYGTSHVCLVMMSLAREKLTYLITLTSKREDAWSAVSAELS